MQTFDLILVGGGLSGASLAAALRDSSLSIALVEEDAGLPQPVSPDAWDVRVYAITPANAAFLAEIGVWAHLDPARMAAVRFMEVREGSAGGRLMFDAREAGMAELAWVLEASSMAGELREGLKRQANLTRFCPARPAALEIGEKEAVVTLEDGRVLAAPLVIGADGRDSWVRQAAGLPARDIPYRAAGVVANFACAKPHRGTAWQWFRADGVLAWLPLPGERISIVWSAPEEKAQALLALTPEELAAEVAAAGGEKLGALTTITPAAAFPLRLIRVPHVIAPRLALIGDAAHGIHPLTGHGINLGFQDARVLAALLKNAVEGQDIGEASFLARYQRARREEVCLLQSVTDLLAHLFSSPLPGLSALRGLGLSLTHRLPAMKNLLARYAAGIG
ncbi:MAG: UbiH/UbiF family hydroxylase [Zoogloeaceae bacterium]|nr:UbiH/UbiF family hydroxylase [Zoogloeaceae bacterium]